MIECVVLGKCYFDPLYDLSPDPKQTNFDVYEIRSGNVVRIKIDKNDRVFNAYNEIIHGRQRIMVQKMKVTMSVWMIAFGRIDDNFVVKWSKSTKMMACITFQKLRPSLVTNFFLRSRSHVDSIRILTQNASIPVDRLISKYAVYWRHRKGVGANWMSRYVRPSFLRKQFFLVIVIFFFFLAFAFFQHSI